MLGHIDQVIGTDLVGRDKKFLKQCPIHVVESPLLNQQEIDLETKISTDMLRRKLESMKGSIDDIR